MGGEGREGEGKRSAYPLHIISGYATDKIGQSPAGGTETKVGDLASPNLLTLVTDYFLVCRR